MRHNHPPSVRSGLFLMAGFALSLALACGGGSDSIRATGPQDSSNQNGWTGALCLESNLTTDSVLPSVAVDGAGNAMVAWQRGSGSTFELWGKSYQASSGWGAEGTLVSQGGTLRNPGVKVGGNGAFMLSWDRSQTSADSEVYVSRWIPGQALDTPLRVDGGLGYGPAMAVNAAGDACAVWMEEGTTYTSVLASRFDAGSGIWTAPEQVSTTTTAYALWPLVAMDSAGDVAVLWSEAVDASKGPYSIRMATFLSGHGWSSVFNPQEGTGLADTSYSLAMSDAGAQAAWSESLDGGATFQVYTCRWNPSGDTLSLPVRLSLSGITGYAPSVGIDAQGRAQAVWVENGGNDLYAAFSNASGAWEASQAIATQTYGLGEVKLSVNAYGEGAVVWQQSNGSLWTIRAALNLSGSGWSQSSILQSNTGGSSYAPEVSIGSGGGIMAVWYQLDAQGIRHIYANRRP